MKLVDTGIEGVRVKPLTVKGTLALLEDYSARMDAMQADDGLFEDLSLLELQAMTEGLTEAVLETITVDELREVADKAREVNRYFFDGKTRRAAHYRRLWSFLEKQDAETLKTLQAAGEKASFAPR